MIGSRPRLGLIPIGPEGEARVFAFAKAMSEVLGTEVDLHQAADYRALVSALDHGIVQFAWLPPLGAARSVRAGSITVAAIAVRSGATSYYTGLITLESSPFHTIADLKGVRVAWVDRESASGYVIIRAALRHHGVSLVDAFKEDLFLRSHGEVMRAVDSGRADVGATGLNLHNGEVQLLRALYNGTEAEPLKPMRIIAQSGPIPSDVFVVHKSVPQPMLAKIQTALVGALPVHMYDAARALMFADTFARPEAEHMRMLDNLYEMASDSAPRSMPPPPPRNSSFPPRG